MNKIFLIQLDLGFDFNGSNKSRMISPTLFGQFWKCGAFDGRREKSGEYGE